MTRRTKNSEGLSLKIDIPEPDLLKPRIVIFGAGGAGGNAINNMIRSNLEGVEFVAANTDAQALMSSLAPTKIQLGLKTTKGLGAGSFPDRGRAAAEENLDEIERCLEGANMVFIAAGMGGGTGTGAAPVIAKLARERDILTVGVVTKPFHFEGKYRMQTAETGIEDLKKYVDTLIVIPNQNLFRIANEHTTFESAFKMADDVLHAGVRGVTDLITMPGLVNLDFADIRTIMTKMGKAMMGTGEAEGENRAILACEAAISNPLLDDISIKGAKGVLVNMTGGPDMTLFEADMAVNSIKKEVDPNANIIFGSAFNENMKGKIRISVVATGIDVEEFRRESLQNMQTYEPSRFRVPAAAAAAPKPVIVEEEEEEIRDNFASENQSFFDPGISAKPEEQDVEEIADVNFKPKKSYAKEENLNYGKTTAEPKKPSSIVDENGFTQISFFNRELDEAEEEAPVISKKTIVKEEVVEVKKAAPVKAAKAKKESSGFSLFSFMNSSNSASKDEEEEVEKVEEEAKEFTKMFSEAKKPKLAEPQANQEKNQEADKKRRQFFAATILDEEQEQQDAKFEDDILNVPAFFRRKK